MIGPLGGVGFAKPEEKAEKAKAAMEKCVPFIESLKPFLEGKTQGFLFGATPYSADFMVGNFYVTNLLNVDMFGQENLDMFHTKFPWLKSYGERFMELCKNYFDNRPKCPM